MSNTEGSTPRAARRHRPAIWGLALAILAVIVALLVLAPWRPAEVHPAGEVSPPATVAPGNTAPPAAPAANP